VPPAPRDKKRFREPFSTIVAKKVPGTFRREEHEGMALRARAVLPRPQKSGKMAPYPGGLAAELAGINADAHE
jgi:hypothetical protein